MTIHVTRHAVLRYQERVAAVTSEEAEAALSSPAMIAAAEFGAREVILGSGHHAVLVGQSVVTVRPRVKVKRRICGRVEE